MSVAEDERTQQRIDTLIDGGLHWQKRWREDGVTLTDAALAMSLEIIALRHQLAEHGIEPINGEWTKQAKPLPFITPR